MINDEICELRDKLNKSIENGESYDKITKKPDPLRSRK